MAPKNPLFQKCIAYLKSLPGIEASIQGESYSSSKVLADGILTISMSGKIAHYVCEIKTGLTSDLIDDVATYVSRLGTRLNNKERPLLITRGLSNIVVDQLLQRNVEFIDVDGNIYLNSPDIYVVVRNQIAKEGTSRSLEITATALQVMYALLAHSRGLRKKSELMRSLDPGITPDTPISDEQISRLSGVSLKTVKSNLKKLQDLDYITTKDQGYEIVDYVKLLERWELGYSERLRAKLLLGTFSPIGKAEFSTVRDQIQHCADEYDYLIGGELGAAIMTDHLRPISAALYLPNSSASRKLAVNLKLKPDLEGNIIFFQAFGSKGGLGLNPSTKNVVNPLLIHAELVWTGNSRLKEMAQYIYHKYIEE